MITMTNGLRLTALDTSFLRMERADLPMHVGAVSTFEGGPLLNRRGRLRIRAIRSEVERRLHLVPRFRQVVREIPLGAGLPVWVDDPTFDISKHVRTATVAPPGDERQLLDFTTELHRQVLDRSRPLWELWCVEGLAGGRVALIEKVHHAMIDGVSGVDVATVLLDLTPDFHPTVAPAWQPGRVPSAPQRLIDAVVDRALLPAAFGRTMLAGWRHPQSWLRPSLEGGHDTWRALGGLERAPSTSLNGPVGTERRLAVIRQPLDQVKEAGGRYGATVNDVIVAAVTHGLRELLDGRGELHDRLVLKALVPVSLRSGAERGQLGNRVGALVAPLPVGIPDPVARLRFISDELHEMKARGDAAASARLLDWANWWPPRLISAAGPLVRRQPFVNVVVTNVPGPPVPLYALGARMLDTCPVVPLGGNLPLGVAILSYNGQLNIGVHADPDACPDLDVFTAGVDRGFAHLVAEPVSTTA